MGAIALLGIVRLNVMHGGAAGSLGAVASLDVVAGGLCLVVLFAVHGQWPVPLFEHRRREASEAIVAVATLCLADAAVAAAAASLKWLLVLNVLASLTSLFLLARIGLGGVEGSVGTGSRNGRSSLIAAGALVVVALSYVWTRGLATAQAVVAASAWTRVAAIGLGLVGVGIALRRELTRQVEEILETQSLDDRASAAWHSSLEDRAHEARNALMAIEGATVTIERYGDRLAPSDRAALTDGRTREFRHLQELVTHDRGMLRSPVVTSVAAALVRAESLAALLGAQVSVTATAGLLVEAPAEALDDVVGELVRNASEHGSGTGQAVVNLTAVRHGRRAVVTVEDCGPGVPRDQCERIFRRGYTTGPGEGLGLFRARATVRRLGGVIWVDNCPGGGSRFVVVLTSPAPTGAGLAGDVRPAGGRR